MRVCNLSSGSDGNITYIESESTKIVVDMGLCCKEVERRLSLVGAKGQDITAILISHEHIDHIKGVDVFVAKYHTPVFVHEDGFTPLQARLPKTRLNAFKDGGFMIGDILVESMPVSHDVVRCTGYVLSQGQKKVGIFTDLGYVDDNMFLLLNNTPLVLLECNHDIQRLLANPRYSPMLKRRIMSKQGHLSNIDCANAIAKLTNLGTRQIVLAHLSTENNSPALAYSAVCEILKEQGITEGINIKIDVATTMPSKIFKF